MTVLNQNSQLVITVVTYRQMFIESCMSLKMILGLICVMYLECQEFKLNKMISMLFFFQTDLKQYHVLGAKYIV